MNDEYGFIKTHFEILSINARNKSSTVADNLLCNNPKAIDRT